jgi:plasmid stability protein
MQYPIRNVPPELDAALRKRCEQLGKSLNTPALEALANMVQQSVRRIDLSWPSSE